MAKPLAIQHEIVTGSPGIDTARIKGYLSPLGLAYRYTAPVFGAAITIDLSQGSYFQIIATASTNITIGAPINVPNAPGSMFIIEVSNQSGGAMGTVTLNAAYKVPATPPFNTAPANGFMQSAGWVNVGSQSVPIWHLWLNNTTNSAN
jgi:hypothetical protein